MFSMPSWLESRSDLLHLRAPLGWQRIQKKVSKLRLDALSIPNNVLKKAPTHGARHGKTEEQREYHIAWNAWKRCCKKVDSQSGHFVSIHDRCLRDPAFLESQLAIGWTAQKCKEMDELAKEDHAHHLTPEEYRRTKDNSISPWSSYEKMGVWNLDPIFELLALSKIVYTASQANKLKPISPNQYRRWHPSSSTSWWDKSEWNWKWAHKFFSVIFFLWPLDSFTVDGDPL